MVESFKADSLTCDEIRVSPNFGSRAEDSSVELLVLHYTDMLDSDSALQWLCDRNSGVSCHYFVYEDGRIMQLVRESDRAWHAGKSYWKGRTDINSDSIGIEIANPGHSHGYVDFPGIQIESVVKLCKDICIRRNIKPKNVLAHSDVSPDRKQDPGELFPWHVLAASGVGLWTAAAPIIDGPKLKLGDRGREVEELQSMLRKYGFDSKVDGMFTEHTELYVRAFQRRFRQQKFDGIADVSTIRTLQSILELQEN